MKKYFFTLLIVLCSSVGSVFAQSGWFPLINAPKSIDLSDIYFINADTGFVNRTNLGAMRTTDGGDTWQPMGFYAGKFKFFFNNTLGVCFSGFSVQMTTNYGQTWTSRPDIQADDIDFPTPQIGYSISGSKDTTRLTLGKSTNGKTWTYRDILPPSPGRTKVVAWRCLSFRDEMHGYLTESVEAWDGSGGGSAGYFTSDGGMTWSVTTPSEEILFLSDSTWLLGSYDGINRTTDDFRTINQVNLNTIPSHPLCYAEGHICKTNDSVVASLDVRTGGIFRSIDRGQTWYQQYCHLSTHIQLNRGGISMPTLLVGYAVGLDSQIYKTIDGGGAPVSVKLAPPCDCNTKLSPEVASGAVTISFDALLSSENLEIYDAIGRQVSSAQIPAEATSYRIDISNYASGMYLAKLRGKMYKFVKVGG